MRRHRNSFHHRSDYPPDSPSHAQEPPDQEETKIIQASSDVDATQPLAPPPRPTTNQQNPTDASDYFAASHNNSHFSLEPNPFEQSFGNPATEAPGNKSLLPSVAALTSPAPLVSGAPSAGGYNWTNSLRSGPLSPAMLGGPIGTGDYFDPSIRGSFPTPNESSLRTGLTPGGGGSMFPAPSPNSQALFQQLQSGGATPSTLDFHRTAMNAAASQKSIPTGANGGAPQSTNKRAPIASMDQSTRPQGQNQAFGENQQHNDAANGLFLLAQAGTDQSNNQFAIPNPPSGMVQNNNQGRAQETSPNMAKRAGRNANGSIGGSLSGSVRGQSELSGERSDSAEQVMPTTRTRSKRTSTAKGAATGTGRRKAEETPSKQPPVKKSKVSNGNNGLNLDMAMDGMESEDEQEQMNIKEEQYHENGKKMTDEEKRKNFLERNRYVHLLLTLNRPSKLTM